MNAVTVLTKGLQINKTEDVIYILREDTDVVVGSGCNASILDLTENRTMNVSVEAGAVLNYYILESGNSRRNFTVSGEVNVSEIGLTVTEEELNVRLVAENARFDSKCLSFASRINSSYHVNVRHSAKFTYSNVANTGVAMEGGKLLFDVVGKIEKGMAKTKCAQLSRGIVMDNESKVDAKPVLLIDEYDCFANHGASIGKVSDEDLFYLMSRGLTKNDACLLILSGIIRPFIDAIPLEDYREKITGQVSKLI